MKTLKPRRTDYRYLCGWFLVACKGDVKKARKRARLYLETKQEEKHESNSD